MQKYNFFKDLDHEWVKAQIFQNTTVRECLERSKVALEKHKAGRPQAWVLDLDSTLFCVSHRTKHAFAQFLREHPQPESWWWRLLEDLGPADHYYGVRTTFRAILKRREYGIAEMRASELWALFEDYWKTAFFSDRFIAYDKAYPGAVEFVQTLHNMGYHIVYLTGRDRPRTLAGTYAALKANSFPLDEHCKLMIKPDQNMSDIDFKTQVTDTLRSQYRVQAFIDNEPENLVMFAKRFPEAEIIFFHSIMSPRVPVENFAAALNGRPALRLDTYEE